MLARTPSVSLHNFTEFHFQEVTLANIFEYLWYYDKRKLRIQYRLS